MERVGALISKLNEQHLQNADVSKLVVTCQMLMAELQQYQSYAGTQGKNVTVVMPTPHAGFNKPADNKPVEPAPVKKEPVVTIWPVEEKLVVEPKKVTEPVVEQKTEQPQRWSFGPVDDVPTLAHQKKELYDVNQSIATTKVESLNERLRIEKIELGSVLQESPIRDLKKAIGINDRYLFINDLFRGDETMYERSIKTINSFNILPEAEYWIQRELKLKLGWNESNDAVIHFNQLIKRRFS